MKEVLRNIENNIRNNSFEYMTDQNIDNIEKLTACLDRLKGYNTLDDIEGSDIDDAIKQALICYANYFQYKTASSTAAALQELKKFTDCYIDVYSKFWQGTQSDQERQVLRIIGQKIAQYK